MAKRFLVTVGESTKPVEVPEPVTTDGLHTVSFSTYYVSTEPNVSEFVSRGVPLCRKL